MPEVVVAATQMACTPRRENNLDKAEALVREAAAKGAQIVLLQELFEVPYFCKEQDARHFALAHALEGNPVIERFSAVARETETVLPISFFERAGAAHYNAVAVLDADGSCLGSYRKSHLPDGPGYQEKFYFSPGDTGFRVFSTRYAKLGVAICWDQWFPEAARSMVLKGAEILLYPTAIGSEPQAPTLDSRAHWQRVMQGHAAANLVPVVASNRIGIERGRDCELRFYGSSFITDHTGELLAQGSSDQCQILTASLDLGSIRDARVSWGLFRERRPELYGAVRSLDGYNRHAGHG